MTGLSGSGKSTLANQVDRLLSEQGLHVYRLDGDNLRFGLNRDLAFSEDDRKENIRRVSEVANLFADAGMITICALIAPFAKDRQLARESHERAKTQFIEVFVDAPLKTTEARDPKGLYKKAREGKIKGFTGIDSPYEAPEKPDVHLRTDELSIEEAAEKLMEEILKRVGLDDDLMGEENGSVEQEEDDGKGTEL